MIGRSFGTPGGSLTGGAAAWVGDDRLAAVGLAGEQDVGAILDRWCLRDGGATVLHDVRIPGSQANIDHLVVAGRTVWLVDAKNWAPGVYWRLFGVAMRGRARFRVRDGSGWKSPADKETMLMACDRVGRFLRGKGIDCGWAYPMVAVRPSRRGGRVRFFWFGMPGATVATVARFTRAARRRCRPNADQRIVGALLPLVRGGA